MLRRTTIFLSTLMCVLEAHCHQNGLYFNSHSYQTSKRTTLALNEGESVNIGNIFNMSFQMDLRNEAPFGNIFCIKTDDGHHIDGIFSVSDDNNCNPSISIDGKFHYIFNNNVSEGTNIPVSFEINRKKGTIDFFYGKESITLQADIKNSRSATIIFGMHTDESNYYDVAPINVRNIRIKSDGKEKFFWPLSNHYGDICIDSIAGRKAVATNGHWLYDTHVKWNHLQSIQSRDWQQVAYNPVDNIFYIVESKKIRCFDPVTKKTKTFEVKGGKRMINSSDYLFYDTTTKTLFNYALSQNRSTRFNFENYTWDNTNEIFEPSHGNHAWAKANDSLSYAFGGYGYYRYKNDLYCINLNNGSIEQQRYTPAIKPRTGSAAAIVDDKMYIFGGYGNESGKQEVPGQYFCDLVCIDLKTMKSKVLWEAKCEQNTSFQLAAEMIYDREKDVFYAATTNQGGRLIRISRNEPKWDVVTEIFDVDLDFRELTFNLYENKKQGKVYIVINRFISDYKHDVDILSLDYPLQDNYMADMERWQQAEQKASPWWWLLLLLIPAGIGAYLYRKKKQTTVDVVESETTPEDKEPDLLTAALTKDYSLEDDGQEEENEEKVEVLRPGQITLLGKFAVTDNEGNDITASYSKRLRDLLLIIILNTQKNSKGIEMREIDDNLWQNMDEVSARNNRNVNISKLRILMDKVGDVKITNDKTYYQINLGTDVSCDYIKAMKYMAKINDGYKDDKTIARTLELLLRGPLVPNVSYEWLDPFKAKYSELALALLNSLLRRAENDKNDLLALKIAETIMLHDPFNDKSLAIQCSIHSRHNRKGIAKKVYDNFCKIYRNSMGEEYDKSFMDVCK